MLVATYKHLESHPTSLTLYRMNGKTHSLVPLGEIVQILIRDGNHGFIGNEIYNAIDPLENAL